jgi:hypothetical protein
MILGACPGANAHAARVWPRLRSAVRAGAVFVANVTALVLANLLFFSFFVLTFHVTSITISHLVILGKRR